MTEQKRKPINKLSPQGLGFLVQWMRWASRLSQKDFDQIQPIMEQMQQAHTTGDEENETSAAD